MPNSYTPSSIFVLILMVSLGSASAVAAIDSVETLKLPVPKRFDLSHVQSKHYAVALGKDPARIFAFVRDQVSYETYIGCLRGPRGTLLAMAGNSVDQAALLASLLRASGETARYARGKLSVSDAKRLVESMWVERPKVTKADDTTKPSPELQATLDTLTKGVKRDYELIRDHLKKAGHKPNPDAAISLTILVEEAQDHYWVQWKQGDRWKNLDPTFSDAAIGSQYATMQDELDSLPENIFHRVEMRIKLEEYAILLQGNEAVTPTSREILNYKVNAADLSGTDIVLSHQPENWTGPATSIQGAIASAIKKTGRVKPILLLSDGKWMAGEAFYQRPPASAGLGSVFTMISGTGTRKPVPIATSESVEFDFIYPDGRKVTVVRDIFDRIGKARRLTGRKLTTDEIRTRVTSGSLLDAKRAAYDLFFTTGSVKFSHVIDLTKDQTRPTNKTPDIRAGLRNLSVTFALSADRMTGWANQVDRLTIHSYPDSPRVWIAELAVIGENERISIDLRRDYVRMVAPTSHSENLFNAQVLRGVINGVLERSLVEHIATGQSMSTSTVFEQAEKNGIQFVLLGDKNLDLNPNITGDTRARILKELQGNHLVVVPEKAVVLNGSLRFAWWRISAKSGVTTGVTDEGLHQGEYHCVRSVNDEGDEIVNVYFVEEIAGEAMPRLVATINSMLEPARMLRYINLMNQEGLPIIWTWLI